jgi:ribosomal protein S18 acetylase RimI-like enzyme
VSAAAPAGGEPRVRPLEAEDLPDAAEVAGAAFGVDMATRAARAHWLERVAHGFGTDPDGSFVAERDGRVVGVAQAMLRDRLWILSLLAVDPNGQSGGAGRALMPRALSYGPSDAPGLIVSSNDARALRLYAMCGFSLLPTLQAEGEVDRRALPAGLTGVREERAPDFDALAAISRAVRGAEHTPELEYVLRRGGRLLRAGDRGFVVVLAGRGPWLLVARDEDTASALLWSALAGVGDGEPAEVRWIAAGHDWAVAIALRAGLRLTGYGALCVRGDVGPLRHFLPSASFG